LAADCGDVQSYYEDIQVLEERVNGSSLRYAYARDTILTDGST